MQVSTEFCIEYERMETCVIQRDWELQYVQSVTHAFLGVMYFPTRFAALELQSLKHELEVC
jgi:hypothetical protein